MRHMKKNEGNVGSMNKRIMWTARIWGSVIIAFVGFFIIATLYSLITTGEADPYAEENIPAIEYSGPVLMVISTMGLAMAWKFEGVGGSITVGGQMLFMIFHLIQRPISLEASFIFPILLSIFVMVPGIFYLAYWKRTRGAKEPVKFKPAIGQTG